jgi:hypothetical protein
MPTVRCAERVVLLSASVEVLLASLTWAEEAVACQEVDQGREESFVLHGTKSL